jgi:hypothetical protein
MPKPAPKAGPAADSKSAAATTHRTETMRRQLINLLLWPGWAGLAEFEKEAALSSGK